ncbi:MAG: putative Ig domain-containing protein [Desulfococcaceae bacterium]
MNSIQIPPCFIRPICALTAACLFGFLSACGGGGGGGSETAENASQTGSLLFSLAISPDAGVRLQRQGFDCEFFNIQFIEAIVFDANGAVVAIGGPWACEDRQGTIQAVPVGDDYEVLIDAIGPEDEVLFSGTSEAISVLPNQTTDAGTILLLPIVNLPPVLSPIGNQSVDAGLPIAIFLEASDPNEGDQLTFGKGSEPPGAFFDPTTGRFEWTPDLNQVGDFPVIFSVADDGNPPLGDSEEIIITVGPGNQPPVIAPIDRQFGVPGDIFEFTVTATDPDPEDTVTLSPQTLPNGATFEAETGIFRWLVAESQTGEQIAVFQAADDGTPVQTDSETVIFNIEPGNQPPRFTPIGNQRVDEGEELVFVVTATDPDGDPLTYTADGLPDGAVFDPPTQTFSWTPGFDIPSQPPIEAIFTVRDNGEPPLEDTLTVQITVGDTNRPPNFRPIEPFEALIGSPIDLVIEATDPDGDELTYEADVIPPTASFNPAERRFQWTPEELVNNTIIAQFTVTDERGLTDVMQIEIALASDNRPPILDPIGNRTLFINSDGIGFLEFPVSASDPDGDFFAFTAGGAPFQRGAVFDSNQRFFRWNAGSADIGAHLVTFTVTDDGNPPESDSETITIRVESTNQPPVFTPIPDQTVGVNDEIGVVFSVSATDPDGDLFTITETGQPFQLGASYDPVERVFRWFPAPEDVGGYVVTFTATDDGVPNAQSSISVNITVTTNNDPPVLEPVLDREVQVGLEPFPFQISLFATDPNPDDNLTFEADGTPMELGASLEGNELTWFVTAEDEGSYNMTFTVTDDGAPPLSDSETIVMTVIADVLNQPPILDPVGDRFLDLGGDPPGLAFTVNATDPDGDDALLSYAAAGTPLEIGANFDPQTREFSWLNASVEDAGTYDVTFTVFDSGTPEETDFETIAITVGFP